MDRRRFLGSAAAVPAATMLGNKLARAEDHLKWAVFTPDSEVTFRTVMKPFAETVQRESDNAVVFDLFPNGALGRNPGQQPQMVLDGASHSHDKNRYCGSLLSCEKSGHSSNSAFA